MGGWQLIQPRRSGANESKMFHARPRVPDQLYNPFRVATAGHRFPRVAPGGATLGFVTLPRWGRTAQINHCPKPSPESITQIRRPKPPPQPSWPFAPTGLCNKAQGCRNAATLGHGRIARQPRRGCVIVPGIWNE